MAALMAIDAIEEHSILKYALSSIWPRSAVVTHERRTANNRLDHVLQIQKPRIKELVGAHSICVIHFEVHKKPKKFATKRMK